MKAKITLVAMALAFGFMSCKTCCKEDGGVKYCKGDLSKDEWNDVVDSCEANDDCKCF
jgi:hypothetical protein